MFFFFSKALFFLIDPLTWILTTLGYAIFTRHTSGRKVGLIVGFALLLLSTNPYLSYLALKDWEHEPVPKENIPLIETAVVLGGAINLDLPVADQLHFNEAADRVTETVRLYKEGLIRHIIVSGAYGSLFHTELREAVLTKEYLMQCGIPGKAVQMDTTSRNTYENAEETAALLRQKDRLEQPILLITSAFHMNRAMACFKRQGLNAVPYPVDYRTPIFTPALLIPSTGAIGTWKMLLKEWVGMAAYKVLGFL